MIDLFTITGLLFVGVICIFAISIVFSTVHQSKVQGVRDFENRWVDRNFASYAGASEDLMGDLHAVLKTRGISSGDFADSSDNNLRRLIDLANSRRAERIQSSDEELIPLLRQVGNDWKQETDSWAATLRVKR